MRLTNVILGSALMLTSHLSSTAQTFIPPNMDFELGTTANWTFYRGSVAMNHVFSLSATSPVSGLHTIMSGSGMDAYGSFPVVGHGLYSLKLAHDTIDNNADATSYNIHVPTGGVYRFDYYYAAVLEGITHAASEQPIMKVNAIDSATGTVLSDSLMLLPSMAGFTLAIGSDIYYKPWTSASINLAGYGGHTIIIKASVAACGTGAHFGYGYIDVNAVTMTSSLSAPPVTGVNKGAINIYPNPTSGTLNIQWTNQQTGTAEVVVTDVTGRIVSRSSIHLGVASGSTQMNMSTLNDGLYFVTIRSAQINYSGRVVVQK